MSAPSLPSVTAPQSTPQLGPEWQSASALPRAPQIPQGAAAFTPNKQAATQYAGAPDGRYGGSWQNRFANWAENLGNNRLFNMGVALMANSGNGGDGQGFLRSMQDFNAQQLEQRRLGNEERRQKALDARESEQWTWAQQERSQVAERRRLASEFIESRPENERAELRMIDPDQLGSYLQDQRQFGLQERQVDLQLAEMRDNRAFRAASLDMDRRRLEQDRLLNSSQNLLGRGEAERMNGDMSRLSNWNMVDNDLRALEEVLQRNPAAFDQILDGDQSVVLARVRDPEMRRDLNTIYAIGTNLAREELRGQTPVSNIDLLSAVRGNPNTQSGSLFVRDWLSRAYQDRADLQGSVQSRLSYMQQGGGRSLYEPDPQTGLNWYQSQDGYTRYGAGPASSGPNAGPSQASPSSSAADQQAAARELAERRSRATAAPSYGTLNGAQGAPRLLREPNDYEATMARQYAEARRTNNQARMRTLEVRMRQRGLIP